MKLKKFDIVEIKWTDAQSLDLGLCHFEDIEKEDIKPIHSTIVGYLIKETPLGYLLCQENWENKYGKYFHFIPEESITVITKLRR